MALREEKRREEKRGEERRGEERRGEERRGEERRREEVSDENHVHQKNQNAAASGKNAFHIAKIQLNYVFQSKKGEQL